MKHFNSETEQILRKLGANGSYIGFQFIIYGVAATIQNPNLITYIYKGLYVEIADHFHTTVYCAERNIRTVKHTIWKYGDQKLISEIFGCQKEAAPPNNAVFIDSLVHYVQKHFQQNPGSF